jgi:hypothetical protein
MIYPPFNVTTYGATCWVFVDQPLFTLVIAILVFIGIYTLVRLAYDKWPFYDEEQAKERRYFDAEEIKKHLKDDAQ